MDITPLVPEGRQIVQSYAEGAFRISNLVYQGPVIIFPDRTVIWDVPPDLDALSEHHFAPLFENELDVILVGGGKVMRSMPFSLKKSLSGRGVSVDFMDTGAACRTYNVLMAEGRRVAAALLPG